MAVVVAPEDKEQFLAYAAEENLEATPVAVVTEEPRLVLNWRGKPVVDIARSFLDTNGAHQETDVKVLMPSKEDNYLNKFACRKIGEDFAGRRNRDFTGEDFQKAMKDSLADLNTCSQKGLVEMFDASIGAGTVDMPYGGKYQLTETQTMIAKLPVLGGKTDTVTMMSYGFDPYLSSWSPYHGAVYAVTESVAKVVAAGGDSRKLHLTFQEYFGRMSKDPSRWSQPFSALLGAYDAQLGFGIGSIGGKDSMSGTFNDIDVPPTLVSFAVDVAKIGDVITPELKKAGDKLVQIDIERDEYDIPVYTDVCAIYERVTELMREGKVKAAYAVDCYGAAPAAAKMAFGNGFGVAFSEEIPLKHLFRNRIGDLILEMEPGCEEILEERLPDNYTVIGTVTEAGETAAFTWHGAAVSEAEALRIWKAPLEKVFPTKASKDTTKIDTPVYDKGSVYVCSHKIAQPTVFIPVFPGTNCEYDTAAAFEAAGAKTITKVFTNLSPLDIRESVNAYAKAIEQAQIIMFPGGFSAGDEPDGSAKFFATAFRNAVIEEAVGDLLNNRDGLILGICNGFQALIKLGLVPNGEITGQNENSPTLTYNTIGRHISKMAYTKVVTNKSPWLSGAHLGGVYTNPASHGEGRFVAPKEWIDKLFANGQVATQYCDPEGNISMDEEWNINGSFAAIEGITSPDGRILGKMAHCERKGRGVNLNIYGEQDLKLFESGVRYFK